MSKRNSKEDFVNFGDFEREQLRQGAALKNSD